MELRCTQRGFAIIEFKDRYGHSSSLQDSSLADEAAIWLGFDNTIQRPENITDDLGQRMHLTQEMVRELLPHLQAFAETGSIRIPEEETNAP